LFTTITPNKLLFAIMSVGVLIDAEVTKLFIVGMLVSDRLVVVNAYVVLPEAFFISFK